MIVWNVLTTEAVFGIQVYGNSMIYISVSKSHLSLFDRENPIVQYATLFSSTDNAVIILESITAQYYDNKSVNASKRDSGKA